MNKTFLIKLASVKVLRDTRDLILNALIVIVFLYTLITRPLIGIITALVVIGLIWMEYQEVKKIDKAVSGRIAELIEFNMEDEDE